MTSPKFEAFLARVYVDEEIRTRFLADPAGTAAAAGLTPDESKALASIDRVGLELAAASFARKRRLAKASRRRGWARLVALFHTKG